MEFQHDKFYLAQVSTLTDGNILVVGNTYHSAAATDTGLVTRFNPTTNQWLGNPQLFVPPATDRTNMRWASATGPNGAAVYAISAISDAGGPFGGNRIFYYTSSDNGVTWSSPNTLFESFVYSVDNDTVTAWLGMDAIYDDNGNFDVVYNTIGNLFTSAKIWVSKNGGPGVIVAANTQIPVEASSLIVSLKNAITMSWPSLALSDDDQYIFCSYSVCKQYDTLNGIISYDLYYSVYFPHYQDQSEFTYIAHNYFNSSYSGLYYHSNTYYKKNHTIYNNTFYQTTSYGISRSYLTSGGNRYSEMNISGNYFSGGSNETIIY